jgi:hypothetical protein
MLTDRADGVLMNSGSPPLFDWGPVIGGGPPIGGPSDFSPTDPPPMPGGGPPMPGGPPIPGGGPIGVLNLDISLSFALYFINKNGTGMASVAIPARIDMAGPIPRLWNMGWAARGRPAAKMERRMVLAAIALAAYIK